MERNWSARASRPQGAWYLNSMGYYYLYGMERAFVFLGIQSVADHSWYLEGASQLLKWQRADGHWEGPYKTPVIDTVFALLFLKRATVPVDTASRVSVPSVDRKNKEQPPEE
jgi:hypothetical protein